MKEDNGELGQHNPMVCSECGTVIIEKVYNFSTSRYGKALCMECQKNNQPKQEEKVKDMNHIKQEKGVPQGVSPENVTTISGKAYIKHEGLLELADQKGVSDISTDIIPDHNFGAGVVLFKATVKKNEGIFTGYGDADDSNVSDGIAKHKIRMAETRAINRALRLATGVGITSAEELGGEQ